MTSISSVPGDDAAIDPGRIDVAPELPRPSRAPSSAPKGGRWLLLNLAAYLSFGAVSAAAICGLAGRWDLWNVWAYTGTLAVFVLLLTVGTYRARPDLLQERLKPATRERV